MSATTTAKIAAAVTGGYLLGRTKKLKLAITLAGLLVGKRLAADPKALANRIVEETPELGHLRNQLTDGLTKAAKDLAIATAAAQMESVTSALQGSTDEATSAAGSAADNGRASAGKAAGKTSGRSRPAKKSGAKKSTAKKTTAKKAPAKKAPAKKSGSSRSSGSKGSAGSRKSTKATASSSGR